MTDPQDFDEVGNQVGERVTSAGARVTVQPYDPAKDRERIRGAIAVAMTALFVVVIAVLMLDALRGRDVDYLTKLAALVVTPVSGLLGAVVGFYYGEQSGRR